MFIPLLFVVLSGSTPVMGLILNLSVQNMVYAAFLWLVVPDYFLSAVTWRFILIVAHN